MAVKKIPIDPNGATPEISVHVGQKQFAKYAIDSFNSAGDDQREVGAGNNIDTLPDTYNLGPAATLAGRILVWEVRIAAPSGGPGEKYFASITVRQGGLPVGEGPFEYGGPLDDAKIILDSAVVVTA